MGRSFANQAPNNESHPIHPTMAMAAYYLKGVSPPEVRLTPIFGGSLPFVFMVFMTMALLYISPGRALWLPHAIYATR